MDDTPRHVSGPPRSEEAKNTSRQPAGLALETRRRSPGGQSHNTPQLPAPAFLPPSIIPHLARLLVRIPHSSVPHTSHPSDRDPLAQCPTALPLVSLFLLLSLS
ncbi:hypothetical protein PCANC_15033 [Puccinia coronata f. sp. avenae]|uniref:Uncharacterized protein n=1 Tax=Puccinia coronata f. sp. avenae TaxID=200324 RepID=A0A2N5U7Z3_9BASI|nr:hypothetical protein PCANC_15033 [Puccinia coronata f. sp. avenae]PLW43220.1 hypothetical protein PCASD_07014 [Puccinia coronata f. sp. avenae]